MKCFICQGEIYLGDPYLIHWPLEADEITETVHKDCVKQVVRDDDYYDVGN